MASPIKRQILHAMTLNRGTQLFCRQAFYRRIYRMDSAWLLLLGRQLIYRSICPSEIIELILNDT